MRVSLTIGDVRATALDDQRRAVATAPLQAQRELCGIMAALDGGRGDPSCHPSMAVTNAICRAQAGPCHLVFHALLEHGVVAHWRSDAVNPDERADYDLHDCTQMSGNPQ